MASSLVHLVETFDFPDKENPSRLIKVRKIHYLGNDPVETTRERGVFAFQAPVTEDQLAELRVIPGYYDMTFREVPDRKTGRAELRLVLLRFDRPA